MDIAIVFISGKPLLALSCIMIIKSEISHIGDEIAIITTAPHTVTEIIQNYKVYDVPCKSSSCLGNLKGAS